MEQDFYYNSCKKIAQSYFHLSLHKFLRFLSKHFYCWSQFVQYFLSFAIVIETPIKECKQYNSFVDVDRQLEFLLHLKLQFIGKFSKLFFFETLSFFSSDLFLHFKLRIRSIWSCISLSLSLSLSNTHACTHTQIHKRTQNSNFMFMFNTQLIPLRVKRVGEFIDPHLN